MMSLNKRNSNCYVLFVFDNENRNDYINQKFLYLFVIMLQMSNLSSNLEVPTYYPTFDEFKNFSSYISKIESYGAHQIGLAKIVPPREWVARKMGYKQKQIEDTMVQNPIKQEVHGKDGFYSVYNIQQRSVKLSQFQKLTSTTRYATPSAIEHDVLKLEKKYWENLTSIAPIYGAGMQKRNSADYNTHFSYFA